MINIDNDTINIDNDTKCIAKHVAQLQVCTSCKDDFNNCSEIKECSSFFDCYRCALVAIKMSELNRQLIDVNDLE